MPSAASDPAASGHTAIAVARVRTPSRFWRWAERWRGEIATGAGLLLLIEALVLPALAWPLGVGGAVAVLVPLIQAVRSRPGLDAVLAEAAEARATHDLVERILHERLDRCVRDLALEAGLGRADVRIYRRGPGGFVRALASTLEPVLEGDRTVLASAWASGVARQPRAGTPERPYSTLLATRVDDRRSGAPLAVVVLDVPGSTPQDGAARRVRTGPAWAQLVGYLEVVSVVVTPGLAQR